MKKIIVLICLVLGLQGCQMLRLKEFQDQLKEPGSFLNFKQNNVSLNHPVLEPVDVLKINNQTEPTRKQVINNKEIWVYEFDKKNGTENLAMELVFLNNKLIKVKYPMQLAELFESYLISKAFESVSKGTYLKKYNTIVPGNVKEIDKSTLPSQAIVKKRLGKPSSIISRSVDEKLSYVYRVVGSDKEMVMNFEFSKEKLIQISGNLFGPNIAFGFKHDN